jgi:hypothetical protein
MGCYFFGMRGGSVWWGWQCNLRGLYALSQSLLYAVNLPHSPFEPLAAPLEAPLVVPFVVPLVWPLVAGSGSQEGHIA